MSTRMTLPVNTSQSLMEVPTRAWNWMAHTGHIVAQGQQHWL
jgi:hypothetical protein